jgi:acyl-CoA thioester hydrolase
MKPNPKRFELAIYPHKLEISARFADMDPQWHLNNVRIAEYYQEGRVSFNQAFGIPNRTRAWLAHIGCTAIDGLLGRS